MPFGGNQLNRALVPVDVIETQASHFAGAETQVCHANRHRIIALPVGGGAVKDVEDFGQLIDA